jgi:rSAM/selenodomain-associated transferase 1
VLFRQRHLIIFARAPRLGSVKSRLAREIGPVAAHACYLALLRGTIERLAARRCWRTWLALAEQGRGFAPRDLRIPHGTAILGQGNGDLGARMRRVFDALPPGPAVLVGSDIPGLAAEHVEAAFAALGRYAAVFGPAVDGGYWLVGVRRLRPLPMLFAGVRWSTASALADTLRSLPVSARLLDAHLIDVDDAASLAAARRTGGAGYFSSASNTPSQSAGGGDIRNRLIRAA